MNFTRFAAQALLAAAVALPASVEIVAPAAMPESKVQNLPRPSEMPIRKPSGLLKALPMPTFTLPGLTGRQDGNSAEMPKFSAEGLSKVFDGSLIRR